MSAVTPDARLADVLGAHPQLLQVLVETSPAFAKLRNPLLRNAMTKLVTVAQAARIGGLDTPDLVQRLNEAIGIEVITSAPAATPVPNAPAPAWIDSPVGAALDVRATIASGGEPFAAIQAAASQVQDGERLVLDAPFEPAPLYKVLAKRGFEHWCEQVTPEHYRVHFLKAGKMVASADSAVQPPCPAETAELGFARVVTIDANLEPPEPMMRVLDALASITPGECLLVHHVRMPVHLIPKLEAEGHSIEVHEIGPGKVDLVITKAA